MKLNKIPINEVTSIINPSIDTLSMCKIRSTASYKSTPNKTQIMRTVAIAPITSYLPYPKVFLSPGDFWYFLFEIQTAKKDKIKPATSES